MADKPVDYLTLILGWIGPQDAFRAAAVSHDWRASAAHAQWRRVVLVASRDPRPTSAQLAAMLHPQCTSRLEELRLRLVTAGSRLWVDNDGRLLSLKHASALRRLELTYGPFRGSQITEAVALAIAQAGNVRDVHLGADLSVRALIALLCSPELRTLKFHACAEQPPDALPPLAARKLRALRCEVKLAPLAWLALFTPPPSTTSLREFELAGKGRCDGDDAVEGVRAFFDGQPSWDSCLARLRLPDLVCPLPANNAQAEAMVEAAANALRGLPCTLTYNTRPPSVSISSRLDSSSPGS